MKAAKDGQTSCLKERKRLLGELAAQKRRKGCVGKILKVHC